jgi:hypothetical protein
LAGDFLPTPLRFKVFAFPVAPVADKAFVVLVPTVGNQRPVSLLLEPTEQKGGMQPAGLTVPLAQGLDELRVEFAEVFSAMIDLAEAPDAAQVFQGTGPHGPPQADEFRMKEDLRVDVHSD